jgi:hypothetical protein
VEGTFSAQLSFSHPNTLGPQQGEIQVDGKEGGGSCGLRSDCKEKRGIKGALGERYPSGRSEGVGVEYVSEGKL